MRFGRRNRPPNFVISESDGEQRVQHIGTDSRAVSANIGKRVGADIKKVRDDASARAEELKAELADLHKTVDKADRDLAERLKKVEVEDARRAEMHRATTPFGPGNNEWAVKHLGSDGATSMIGAATESSDTGSVASRTLADIDGPTSHDYRLPSDTGTVTRTVKDPVTGEKRDVVFLSADAPAPNGNSQTTQAPESTKDGSTPNKRRRFRLRRKKEAKETAPGQSVQGVVDTTSPAEVYSSTEGVEPTPAPEVATPTVVRPKVAPQPGGATESFTNEPGMDLSAEPDHDKGKIGDKNPSGDEEWSYKPPAILMRDDPMYGTHHELTAIYNDEGLGMGPQIATEMAKALGLGPQKAEELTDDQLAEREGVVIDDGRGARVYADHNAETQLALQAAAETADDLDETIEPEPSQRDSLRALLHAYGPEVAQELIAADRSVRAASVHQPLGILALGAGRQASSEAPQLPPLDTPIYNTNPDMPSGEIVWMTDIEAHPGSVDDTQAVPAGSADEVVPAIVDPFADQESWTPTAEDTKAFIGLTTLYNPDDWTEAEQSASVLSATNEAGRVAGTHSNGLAPNSHNEEPVISSNETFGGFMERVSGEVPVVTVGESDSAEELETPLNEGGSDHKEQQTPSSGHFKALVGGRPENSGNGESSPLQKLSTSLVDHVVEARAATQNGSAEVSQGHKPLSQEEFREKAQDLSSRLDAMRDSLEPQTKEVDRPTAQARENPTEPDTSIADEAAEWLARQAEHNTEHDAATEARRQANQARLEDQARAERILAAPSPSSLGITEIADILGVEPDLSVSKKDWVERLQAEQRRLAEGVRV
ncbi:MAG: hypothetical protein AAF413_00055 [Patescibacteria group bacterium]